MALAALQTPSARFVWTRRVSAIRWRLSVGAGCLSVSAVVERAQRKRHPAQLVAFDESGAIRTLYSTERDRFFAGPGAAVATRVESWVEFQRESSGQIASLTWRRDGAPLCTARRVAIEKSQKTSASRTATIQLAGTLISPTTEVRHPVVILVHASGPVNRDYMLPFARFLIRHGMAVFGYDKRGVGGIGGQLEHGLVRGSGRRRRGGVRRLEERRRS